jgi:hypothetical protein
MTNDWSAEEPDDPLYADRRNFYKVEKSGAETVSGSRNCCSLGIAWTRRVASSSVRSSTGPASG